MKQLLFGFCMVALVIGVIGFFIYPGSLAKSTIPHTVKQTSISKFIGKNIFYIDSYHVGYAWSDKENAGAKSVLADSGVKLNIFYMDTNRHPEETWAKAKALEIKSQIETTKPDLIIAADDAAVKYVIMPYFKNAIIPVVFCGVNWDASSYGIPYSNTTGILEVSLVPELVARMKDYAKGVRIGFIAGDVLTNRKESVEIPKKFSLSFSGTVFPNTFIDWKKEFLDLQSKSDMIFFYSNAGIFGWDNQQAVNFLMANAKVPIGTTLDWMMDFSHIGYTKIAEEQGEWAADTALDILGGKKPNEIKIVTNTKGITMLNVGLANTTGIVFKSSLVKNATIINNK
jgi:ABC-type uncharacterized transport system substrate-binding protein